MALSMTSSGTRLGVTSNLSCYLPAECRQLFTGILIIILFMNESLCVVKAITNNLLMTLKVYSPGTLDLCHPRLVFPHPMLQ